MSKLDYILRLEWNRKRENRPSSFFVCWDYCEVGGIAQISVKKLPVKAMNGHETSTRLCFFGLTQLCYHIILYWRLYVCSNGKNKYYNKLNQNLQSRDLPHKCNKCGDNDILWFTRFSITFATHMFSVSNIQRPCDCLDLDLGNGQLPSIIRFLTNLFDAMFSWKLEQPKHNNITFIHLLWGTVVMHNRNKPKRKKIPSLICVCVIIVKENGSDFGACRV